jgi:drug/metabolite transporter (DMT)-like permease
MGGRLRPYLPELALVVASVTYGTTFVVVQDSLDHVSASAFNVLRFGLAALVLAPIAGRRGWRGPEPRPTDRRRTLLILGIGLGLASFVAYQTQNVGLDHTSTSNAGFITGLFVVFIPIIAGVRYRRWPPRRVVAAVLLSTAGLFLLTGAHFRMGFGDAVVVLSALAWAVWTVATGEVTRRFDTFSLILVQVTTVAAVSAVVAAFEGFGTVTGTVVVGVVATGLGCSVFAFALSTWAQRVVEAERAGVINLSEPVVVGIVGYFVGERLGIAGYLGAALIVTSIVVVERGSHAADAIRRLRPARRSDARHHQDPPVSSSTPEVART